jgi:hypothetical protein
VKRVYKITLPILILINLALAVYAVNNWQNKKSTNKAIPTFNLTNNELIKSYLRDLTEKSTNKQAVVALISVKSSNCKNLSIVDLLKQVKTKSPNTVLRIVLPKEFSDQDLTNFKSNLEVDFEVVREDEKLSAFWQPLAEKYNALGVIIIAKGQELFASQNVAEIQNQIKSL